MTEGWSALTWPEELIGILMIAKHASLNVLYSNKSYCYRFYYLKTLVTSPL